MSEKYDKLGKIGQQCEERDQMNNEQYEDQMWSLSWNRLYAQYNWSDGLLLQIIHLISCPRQNCAV